MNEVISSAFDRAASYFKSTGVIVKDIPAASGDIVASIQANVSRKVDHAGGLIDALRGASFEAPEHVSEDVLSPVFDDMLEAVRLLGATRELRGVDTPIQHSIARRLDALADTARASNDVEVDALPGDSSYYVADSTIDQLKLILEGAR